VVSVTASVGHELFPLDPTGGRVLSARDAVLATRAEVGAVARTLIVSFFYCCTYRERHGQIM
jgi:hypothetical protein